MTFRTTNQIVLDSELHIIDASYRFVRPLSFSFSYLFCYLSCTTQCASMSSASLGTQELCLAAQHFMSGRAAQVIRLRRVREVYCSREV
ncbi:unnamed protein product [Arctogadus glacialis]